MSITLQDQKKLKDYFSNLSIEDDFEAILKKSRVLKIKKGQCWIEQGTSVSEVAIILKGGIKKVVSLPDGREVVKGFLFENHLTANYSSIIKQKPALFSIVAIEDLVLFCMPYAEVKKRFDTKFHWQALARSIAEELFIESEQRELALLANQSKELLQNLIDNNFLKHAVNLMIKLKFIDKLLIKF